LVRSALGLVRRLSQQGDGAIPQTVKNQKLRPNSRVVKPLAYIRQQPLSPSSVPLGKIATVSDRSVSVPGRCSCWHRAGTGAPSLNGRMQARYGDGLNVADVLSVRQGKPARRDRRAG
jgi:hypothetical protein